MRLLALAFLLAAAPTSVIAQSLAPVAVQPVAFDKIEAKAAVRDLAAKLESTYVFPDVGQRYAAMLRANLAVGRYDSFPNAEAFAQAVSADIQALHPDGHLKLQVLRPNNDGKRKMKSPTQRSGLVKSGWLGDGVAYVAFAGFPGNEASLNDLKMFIAGHGGAKSLIIDLRSHSGGGMDEVNLLFPQLFTAETALLEMDARESVAAKRPPPSADDYVRLVKGPPGVIRREHYVVPAAHPALGETNVYVLVGRNTVSAAEHMAMALKRTHRATLIGEPTRGAGNFGMFEEIGSGFEAFIPFGRTFDPDTGEGWEGVGVKPDIAVPADQALDKALELAGVSKTSADALASLH